MAWYYNTNTIDQSLLLVMIWKVKRTGAETSWGAPVEFIKNIGNPHPGSTTQYGMPPIKPGEKTDVSPSLVYDKIDKLKHEVITDLFHLFGIYEIDTMTIE